MNLQLVNKAIYAKLKAIQNLAIADSVSTNAKRPYVVLAETLSTPWNSKTTRGFEVAAGVLIYSDYKGDKEINDLVQKVHKALEPILSIGAGYKIITQSIETVNVERVEDYREAQIDIKLKIFKEE